MDIVYKKLSENELSRIIKIRIDQLTEEYISAGKTVPQNADLESALMDFYNGMIKMQEPVDCDSYDLPEEIKALLSQTNGIQETMILPKTGEEIVIGWIVYSLDEILRETQYYREEYGINGVVFSGDGAGNPFYISDGKIYEFDPIDNESELKADSLEEFYKQR